MAGLGLAYLPEGAVQPYLASGRLQRALEGLVPAVTADGAGTIWANEINTDTVVRFDPKTEKMQVIRLPSSNTGIRKMMTDASGRLWYMGSHSGRLGVVE